MIVQNSTFSKSLNPRNIDKSVSDIRIRIWFPFDSSFWISVSGCKLTILPDIHPGNRIVIISVAYMIHSRSYSFLFTLTIAFIAIFDYKFNIQNFTFISQSVRP